jgi:uncharacterized protein (DUF1778 family)
LALDPDRALIRPAICRTIKGAQQMAISAVLPRQRDQRLEARITADQKALIERAASVQGRTVTDFVVATLQEAAKQAIAEHTVWKLSQEQQKVFIDALLEPPLPNAKLRDAHKRYRQYKRQLSGTRR